MNNLITIILITKKLQIAKLRSIAIERGLVSNTEASKLKKPELLKLFDFE
jgi:hypothetical protein